MANFCQKFLSSLKGAEKDGFEMGVKSQSPILSLKGQQT
jgi:hypothetical protein